MTSIYSIFEPSVNRELRHYCRFSTIVSKAYTIYIYSFKTLVLIMNICIKALNEYLCNLNLPVSYKYAYLKLCTDHKPFYEFYIFKPGLSNEWGVAPKSVERYFSRFEKHKLFARNHKKSKEVGKSGPALYGKLTPPACIFLQAPPIPELPSVRDNEAKDVLLKALPQNNIDYEILKHFYLKQENYKKQLEEPGVDKAKLCELANCLGTVINIIELIIIKAENSSIGNQ